MTISPKAKKNADNLSKSGLKLNSNYLKVKSKIADYSNGNMKIDELMEMVRNTSPRLAPLSPLKQGPLTLQPQTTKNDPKVKNDAKVKIL